jgi:23S rRNA (uracil1939-C5)-methyltransferase
MIGSVRAIAKGGAGIVRDGGRTVFVPGVVEGETVEFADAGRRHGAWHGRLLRVLEPSPRRVAPPCPHYGECGGCNLQHMEYAEQLRVKAAILQGNLRALAGTAAAGAGLAVLASPPWNYRSKVEFQVRGGAAGFFARDSQRVVTINGCPLLPRPLEAYFLARRPALADVAAGQLRVVSNGSDIASRLDSAGQAGSQPGSGPGVRIRIGAHAFRFAPDHFVQANLFQLGPMLALLEAVLERERPDRAADLFCGAGFFTLPLAARCREVAAMESDTVNVAGLRANLEASGVGNVTVATADVLRSALPASDLVVVDPPRGGLSARLIAALAACGAPTIVYFSCDSATFARDLRLFSGVGFEPTTLTLIDNFPHSDHFEIFSVLKRG